MPAEGRGGRERACVLGVGKAACGRDEAEAQQDVLSHSGTNVSEERVS